MVNRYPVLMCMLVIAFLLAGCREDPPQGPRSRHPWIVIGIDGGEWDVIRDLWSQDRLPHLKALAERGITAQLRTRYTASPVIWTTIATGVRPEEHGITDFVVPTEAGDIPVSSTLRRLPAIWTMLTRVKRRVAVLGWWASWPAEEVEGIVVSDRAWLDVDHRVSPPEFLPRFLKAVESASGEENLFFGNSASRERDRTVAWLGRQLATEGFELLLVYFRGVDIASHNHWKHYRPAAFPEDPPDAAEVAAFGERIPREYEAVDRALGSIVAAAPEKNIMVISDHGFRPARREIVKVFLDFDGVLERLGYLERQAGEVDLPRSQLYTFASPDFRRRKAIRFAFASNGEQRLAVRAKLTSDLARITYGGGEPVFKVVETRPKEAREQIDFVVQVAIRGATRELLLDGDAGLLEGLVTDIHRVSGTHGEKTHGIFLAAGPDVAAGASRPTLEGIHIHDITPTLLYGLGLPVAKNFAGHARTELFNDIFRDAYPLRTIAAWDIERDGFVTMSKEDEALVRELGALGYLD